MPFDDEDPDGAGRVAADDDGKGQETDATAGAGATADGDPESDGEGAGDLPNDDADVQELAQKHKLTPEQQAAFNKAIGKKTAQRRKAEESAAALEKERDQLARERDELKGKVGDDAVLAAAQQAGILPEYVSAEEVKTVSTAETTRQEVKNLRRLVRAGEEFTGNDASGREHTWSIGELSDLLDNAEERLERIAAKAERIKAKAADEIRADLEAGRKIRKGGGNASRQAPAAGAQRGKILPPAIPGETGGTRRDQRSGGSQVDWSKVADPESMREQLLREERAHGRK